MVQLPVSPELPFLVVTSGSSSGSNSSSSSIIIATVDYHRLGAHSGLSCASKGHFSHRIYVKDERADGCPFRERPQ